VRTGTPISELDMNELPSPRAENGEKNEQGERITGAFVLPHHQEIIQKKLFIPIKPKL